MDIKESRMDSRGKQLLLLQRLHYCLRLHPQTGMALNLGTAQQAHWVYILSV